MLLAIWLYTRRANKVVVSMDFAVPTLVLGPYCISLFWLMDHPSTGCDEVQLIMEMEQIGRAHV
jgi:hypothetical protein